MTEPPSPLHDSPVTVEVPGESGAPEEWVTLASPAGTASVDPPVSGRRILLQLVVGVVAVLAVVTGGGAFASQRLAEREAVNDAANTADLLAEAVVQPSLTDDLVDGDADALEVFDAMVRDRVLSDRVVRLKLWAPDGTVIYADQPELIGQRFELEGEELEVLRDPRTVAEISDLSRSENDLDRSISSKLVEVYRPIWTPTGQEVLFEIYAPYDQVSQRTGQLWRGFAGITLTSMLLFLLLVSPIVWRLSSRVRSAQRQREEALRAAVEAGANERRRIAASLHDGPVQELAAGSFVVAGAAAQADAAGQSALAGELRTVSATVRTSIRALRTLLVDLYPASMSRAGLVAALNDLAQTVATDDLAIEVAVDPGAADALTPEQERVVFRVAQETLRNSARHAAPGAAVLSLSRGDDGVVLEVSDDGPGFDVESVVRDPAHGHFGLRLLADSADDGGATLAVRSGDEGTTWRLTVPIEESR